MAGARLGAVLFKFITSKDYQVVLWVAGTKLGLDEDFTPTQQARGSELRPLFKEAKAAGKHAFWCATELFVYGIQIFPPSTI